MTAAEGIAKKDVLYQLDENGEPILDEEGKPLIKPGVTAADYSAALAGALDQISPTTGVITQEARADEIQNLTERAVAAERDASAEEAAKAATVDAVISEGAFVPEVTGVGGEVSATADAEVQTRTAITGTAPTAEEAQMVNTLGFEAAQRSTVQGAERTGAAATMIAETGAIPSEIAAAIVENPATVEAQIATEDVTGQAAVDALPPEALMSAKWNH